MSVEVATLTPRVLARDGAFRIRPVLFALIVMVCAAGLARPAWAQGPVVRGGDNFSASLSCDGVVRTWGRNDHGQLGLGDLADRLTPQPVSLPTTATAVACGRAHVLALLTDGTLWAWGLNDHGQLGNGTTTTAPLPVLVLAPPMVSGITAGASHSVALLADGIIWTWGLNTSGQLGIGAATEIHAPQRVPSLFAMKAVASKHLHTLAIRFDGTVWAWGDNTDYGALGTGSLVSASVPVQVPTIHDAIAIDAGAGFSFAIQGDGTLHGWGRSTDGQLGLGTATYGYPTPHVIPGITGARAVAAGYSHAVVLLSDGTVRVAGSGFGAANAPAGFASVGLTGLTGVTGIAAGSHHSMAARNDGVVLAWGSNTNGQLGLGSLAVVPNPVATAWALPPCVTGISVAGGTLGGDLTITATGSPAAPYGIGIITSLLPGELLVIADGIGLINPADGTAFSPAGFGVHVLAIPADPFFAGADGLFFVAALDPVLGLVIPEPAHLALAQPTSLVPLQASTTALVDVNHADPTLGLPNDEDVDHPAGVPAFHISEVPWVESQIDNPTTATQTFRVLYGFLGQTSFAVYGAVQSVAPQASVVVRERPVFPPGFSPTPGAYTAFVLVEVADAAYGGAFVAVAAPPTASPFQWSAATPVFLVHGLFGDTTTFGDLQTILETNPPFIPVRRFLYDATDSSCGGHAGLSAKACEFSTFVAQTNFADYHVIAHSMGGLVVRQFFVTQPPAGGRHPRLVCLGTPQFGSVLAVQFGALAPSLGQTAIDLGTASQFTSDLADAWPTVAAQLRTLNIIGTCDGGLGDSVVRTSEAFLPDHLPSPAGTVLNRYVNEVHSDSPSALQLVYLLSGLTFTQPGIANFPLDTYATRPGYVMLHDFLTSANPMSIAVAPGATAVNSTVETTGILWIPIAGMPVGMPLAPPSGAFGTVILNAEGTAFVWTDVPAAGSAMFCLSSTGGTCMSGSAVEGPGLVVPGSTRRCVGIAATTPVGPPVVLSVDPLHYPF